MINTIRDLLISLSSHMAYMQGQLEARHELDDLEDFYWYRESVALRQKVTDALADEPDVPEGRYTRLPSDEEVEALVDQLGLIRGHANHPCGFWIDDGDAGTIVRAALTRWGNHAPAPLADGEVAELTGKLVEAAPALAEMGWDQHAQRILRATKLLRRQALVPVSVSERLPRPEDCDDQGRCWIGRPEYDFPMGDTGKYGHANPEWCLEPPADSASVWLPAHALPLPEAER